MSKGDNPINATAWYFRVADVIAPVMIFTSAAAIVFSLHQFTTSF